MTALTNLLMLCLLACGDKQELPPPPSGDTGAADDTDTTGDDGGGEDTSPPGDTDPGGETADPDDTAPPVDTEDTAPPEDTQVEDPLPDWLFPHTVPVDRGFEWQIDWDFVLDNHTVPTIWVMPDGEYGMFATDMADMGRLYLWRSADGLEWAQDADPTFTVDMFEGYCGEEFLDLAVVHLPDGRVRVLLEGFNLQGLDNPDINASTICSAVTSDGVEWTLEEPGAVFQPHAADDGWTSVLEVTWYAPTEEYLLYYVGGGDSDENSDTVHLATSPDGEVFTPQSDYFTITTPGGVDPCPVIEEEGGGVRLYYTRNHPGGNLGLSLSEDGRSFEDQGYLKSLLERGECQWDMDHVEGDAICPMDPFFLRLPDDRLVLYFTAFEKLDDGRTIGEIRRAFATD
jgi:hypothetical protein